MIKTNIKMRVTPEQSKKVQEICFSNGVYWYNIHNKDKVIVYSDYLYIDEYIKHDSLNSSTYFKDAKAKEIDADLFIKTNGTCEEKYKTEYLAKYVNHTNKDSMPKDYDDALKKISNLRIALNKKVDKNKNQALEITNLLEQKKDLQEENSYLEKTIDNINLTISNIMGYPIDERCEKTSYLKAIEKKFENTNNEVARINELNKYLKEAYEIRLKEKDIIISHLESKLK